MHSGSEFYTEKLVDPMTLKRKVEVLTKLLKHVMRDKSINFKYSNKRGLVNIAKWMKVGVGELEEILKPILHELVDEAFKEKPE